MLFVGDTKDFIDRGLRLYRIDELTSHECSNLQRTSCHWTAKNLKDEYLKNYS